MQTYSLTDSLLPVTRIAYGCMRIGATWDDSPLDKKDRLAAFAAIETALAEGINFFDHADIYCRGKSEQVFGEFLSEHAGIRDQIILQSKFGIRPAGTGTPEAPGRYDFRRDYIIESVENILSRLGVEQLDILLLHRPDCLIQPEEVADAFESLYASGKVKEFGVSNHTIMQIELLKKFLQQPIIANQLQLSLTHHYLISEGILTNRADCAAPLCDTGGLLDYCRLHNISVQAWSPAGNTKLFGDPDKMSEAETACYQGLQTLAQKYECPLEAIAMAWLLRHPADIQPVIGSKTPARISDCCQGESITLTHDEWYFLLSAARGVSIP
jgi:predicted oxidoreductase